jgi:hypothetical protein
VRSVGPFEILALEQASRTSCYFSPKSQASAQITARAENHLRDLEWRIGRLGALVAAGQADRRLVTERLGVAIELARLDDEPPR